jgi:hypothetical protein
VFLSHLSFGLVFVRCEIGKEQGLDDESLRCLSPPQHVCRVRLPFSHRFFCCSHPFLLTASHLFLSPFRLFPLFSYNERSDSKTIDHPVKRLTNAANKSDINPIWLDETTVAFLSNRSGSMQVRLRLPCRFLAALVAVFSSCFPSLVSLLLRSCGVSA